MAAITLRQFTVEYGHELTFEQAREANLTVLKETIRDVKTQREIFLPELSECAELLKQIG